MAEIYLSDPDLTIWHGDALEALCQMPDESVDCVVTSPPYFSLRDYGVEGQLGLEDTPEKYVEKLVEVFREVHRVLANHGTVFLNIGDSYVSDPGKGGSGPGAKQGAHVSYARALRPSAVDGLRPKNLLGIPWRVAFALQQPYYAGKIKHETDRVWLAAMVEAEGCMFIHRRKAGTPAYSKFRKADGTEVEYQRKHDTFGVGLEVSSTDRAIVERCMEIAGIGSICEQTPEQNARRKQPIYRWNARTNECRAVIRELYPYFVAKQHEARLLLSCPSSGDDASKAWSSLKALHQGQSADIDFAAPGSMFEGGWYLRSDIIWSKKPNPMPESITDRPTKSHEYLFLLAKSSRYFFDQEAVREPAEWARWGNQTVPKYKGTETATGWMKNGEKEDLQARAASGRNIRSVWTIPTQPYADAHFATFPMELPRRAIAAGCPLQVCRECGQPRTRIVEREVAPPEIREKDETSLPPTEAQDFRIHNFSGQRYQDWLEEHPPETVGWTDCGHDAYRTGVVLDPFFGSGTTALAARALSRNAVGIELSESYSKLAAKRLAQQSLFTEIQP